MTVAGVLSSCSVGVASSQQTQSVSGLPHLYPSCVFNSHPEINTFIFPLCSSKIQLVLYPLVPTSSGPRFFFFTLTFFLPFPSRCGLNTCAEYRCCFFLSLLASATVLSSSLGVLGERSRYPAATAYSHQSYRFSHDTGPSNAMVLSYSTAPWEMTNAPSNGSLICPAFWNGSLARLNVSRARPIAGFHVVG